MMKKPVLDSKFSNFLLMSNLPEGISQQRVDKLKSILKMIMEKKGVLKDLVELTMGMEGDLSNGFALLEFTHEDHIKKGIQELNNLVLDKSHTLKTYTMQEYETILETAEQLETPSILKEKDL